MRILAIIRKEFIHISRDFRTLMIVIVMPVVMLFLYGYAINMEVQNINVLALDHSRSPQSRELISKFEGSTHFTVYPYDGPVSDIENYFARREADMALIIPQDFSESLQRNRQTPVQLLIDASDPNAAQSIRSYGETVCEAFAQQQGGRPLLYFEPTIWYNPSLKSSYFFVPGLVVLILMMISALLTSVAIVREKETGTMEQILVSPVKPAEIIIGKVVPYIFLALVDLFIILTIAHFVFEVPFVGSLFLLICVTLIFIILALGLGLLISTRAHTQQVAMMMALMATLLPTLMLSGFMFPLAGLPLPLRIISYAVPARYFLVIIRGIMLKGSGLFDILAPLGVLIFMAAFFLTVSAKRFSTNLEGQG